ncbi:SDR family oxidoreductase [Geopsychrobacter electrodiphilus]|uniref:SDR family oxidoreductase n=1 Tax=Geopsychrobacter electrodiphilus TaxID=225196 RepID=UPI0003737C6C|nr:SDR family oxidoreductase [Geopsychrobacter electrodiphilus]
MEVSTKPIFVAGATGYIGGRLLPRLLDSGYQVRALVRAPEKLRDRPWAQHPNLSIIKGDVLDSDALIQAIAGCRAAYYLVHSMSPEVKDFSVTDRTAARNMVVAAEAANLEQIIYLSGLGEEQSELSHHLQSRTEVGNILRQGAVPVTILRAAMIIGSGSASFEILRYLVDRLPVMITPRWVSTPCQPIGVRNVLHYLLGCLEHKDVVGGTFDIGQPEVIDYRQLMEVYAEEAGLPRRWIIPVPVLTPRLSSYWIHLVTPVPASIARPLAEGLSNPVVCRENRIAELLPQELFDTRKAIRLALDRIKQHTVETSWTDSGEIHPAEWSNPGDPAWAGGSLFSDARRIVLNGQPEDIWPAVSSIGGEVGYYYANWLWEIRGFIDRICGGVGLCRGRRSASELFPGDVIDFWRVVAVEKCTHLMLSAEMKLPGEAVLSFRLNRLADGQTELQQIARFLPRGLFGLLYWYAVMPFHHYVFNGMLRGIAEAAGQTISSGPEKIDKNILL